MEQLDKIELQNYKYVESEDGRIEDGMLFPGTEGWYSREVIVMDANKDRVLRGFIDTGMAGLREDMDIEEVVVTLFRYLNDKVHSADRRQIEEMKTMSRFQKGNVLMIGEIITLGWGVCRHKALLMQKLLQEAEKKLPQHARELKKAGIGSNSSQNIRI